MFRPGKSVLSIFFMQIGLATLRRSLCRGAALCLVLGLTGKWIRKEVYGRVRPELRFGSFFSVTLWRGRRDLGKDGIRIPEQCGFRFGGNLRTDRSLGVYGSRS